MLKALVDITEEMVEAHKYCSEDSACNDVQERCKYFKDKADVVEVKRGEWKLHPDGSGTCSCCNRTQKAVWDYDNKQNFCGHCGADMRGKKDG